MRLQPPRCICQLLTQTQKQNFFYQWFYRRSVSICKLSSLFASPVSLRYYAMLRSLRVFAQIILLFSAVMIKMRVESYDG